MLPDFEPDKQELPDEADSRGGSMFVCFNRALLILNRQAVIFLWPTD